MTVSGQRMTSALPGSWCSPVFAKRNRLSETNKNHAIDLDDFHENIFDCKIAIDNRLWKDV